MESYEFIQFFLHDKQAVKMWHVDVTKISIWLGCIDILITSKQSNCKIHASLFDILPTNFEKSLISYISVECPSLRVGCNIMDLKLITASNDDTDLWTKNGRLIDISMNERQTKMPSNYQILMEDAKENINLFIKYKNTYSYNQEKIKEINAMNPADVDTLELLSIQLKICESEINEWKHCLKHTLRISQKLLSEDEWSKLRTYININL